YSEIERRRTYLEQLVSGAKANVFRPHPAAPIADWTADSAVFRGALPGQPCVLSGAKLTASARWQCKTGLTCEPLVTNASTPSMLGQCAPPKAAIFAGLSCRKNDIDDHTRKFKSVDLSKNLIAYNVLSFQDRVTTDAQIYGLPEGKVDAATLNCRPTKIGVPLGRVTRACTLSEMSLVGLPKDKTPNDICAVVGGKGFEEMAKGYFDSVKFAAGVGRGVLNVCGPDRGCREDYICQEMPEFLTGDRFKVPKATYDSLKSRGLGFCTPTYFVYQLRLDGHPNPN
ncbi:MAG: hypothetical protein V4692_07415, partial [Bdellovibrionota bacterium]